MKFNFCLLILIFLTCCSESKQSTEVSKNYLDEVFQIVEKHSIRRDSVNFNEIKKKAYAQIKDKDSIEDCYPIVASILRDLGDNHSFFMPKNKVKKWQTTSKTLDIGNVITFSGKLLDQNVGYIHLKGFNSGDSVSIQQYADSLQNQIKSIDHAKLKGWIIDLRENTGGNCWPMLTGLGPLLGNGICGYFIDNKKIKSSWFYKDGESGIGSKTITDLYRKPYELIDNTKPLAILTGNRTASSGEIMVTAFRGMNKTRSFGKPTAGLSTGNENYTLSDGSMIFVTTTVFADRKENIYGYEIKPDEFVSFSYDQIGRPDDPVIEKAKEWIISY